MNEWLEVHALLDDELAPGDRAHAQDLIKTNRACEAEWYAVRQVKAVVSQKCVAPDCEELWNACIKRLQQIERTRTVESFVGRYAWGICGAFALVIVGAAAINRLSGGALSTRDVARVSASLIPISAPRSQAPDDVSQWLRDNLDKTMKVPTGRIRFIGGGIGHLSDGRRIEELNLSDGQGPLRYYEIEGAEKVDGVQPVVGHEGFSSSTMDNRNCVTWTANGKAYVLTGDRSIESLCQTAASSFPASSPQ